jgi:hypothetical protein
VIRAISRYEHILPKAEIDRLDRLVDWFNDYLRVPSRLTLLRHGHARRKAICWFKRSAARYIARAKEIAAILHKNHITTELWLTHKPGYIVYEDANQVAAVPFRDTMVARPSRRAPTRFHFAQLAVWREKSAFCLP